MKTPHLVMAPGNSEPLWGHCSSCDVKFSPKNMGTPRAEQEAEMRADFLQHLAKAHAEESKTESVG